MKNIPLHWKIIIGLILGIIYSLLSSYLGWNKFTQDWIDPFGTIFIRLLKFIAVPLVLFSIISGVAGLPDPTKLGRMGIKTMIAYISTTVFAVCLGLFLVNIFNPGAFISEEQRIKNRIKYEIWVSENPGISILDGKDFINNPKYSSYLNEAKTENNALANSTDVTSRLNAAQNIKGSGPMQFFIDFVPDNIFVAMSDGGKMLQVIFFAVFFGIVLMLIPKEKTKYLMGVIDGANEVFLKMVGLVMDAAPFFVFALMAGVISKMADTPAQVFEIFKSLLSYSMVLTLGLLTLILIVYPLIVKIVVKELKTVDFFKKISPAQFLAFSTSSSAATLPVTMEVVKDNLGVSSNVSNFVLPIGATVNMDGTAMYQAVAVVFLAQLHWVDLTLAQQLTIVFTATLSSIGSAAVPSAGLIMMIIVLQSVGLNPAWIAIIIPVDRILDMLRTVVNVSGDIVVSLFVAKTENELNLPEK